MTTLGCQATSFFSADEPAAPAPPTPSTEEPVSLIDPVESKELTPPDLPISFTEALTADIDSFNPVLATSDAAATLLPLILPRLVGQDPQSGAVAANDLASDWRWSLDGRTITFTLRSDVLWSDGRPVTARDVGFTLAALAHPQVGSPLVGLVHAVERVELSGDYTLTLGLTAPDCTILDAMRLPILPSHIFAADFSDVRTNSFNEAPTVGAGPFLFASRQPGREIALVGNPDYWRGAPNIGRYFFRIVPSAEERLRLAEAGEIDLAEIEWSAQMRLRTATGVRLVQALADGYSFLALNLADPFAPAPGVDAGGVVQRQSPHPLFGDLAVRRAILRGVDFSGIVADVYGDPALRPAGYIPQAVAWAALTSASYTPHDPQAARTLLEEAGWVDAAGDGVRERGEELLQATLIVNDDNPQRLELAQQIHAQLEQLGFVINLEALPFTRTAEIVLGQQFDMALLGWEHLGAEPARLAFWSSNDDAPGQGLNVTSYQRDEVDALLWEARFLPGCDLVARGERYRHLQRMIQEDAAMIPLVASRRLWALASGWDETVIAPWSRHAGVEQWAPIR